MLNSIKWFDTVENYTIVFKEIIEKLISRNCNLSES